MDFDKILRQWDDLQKNKPAQPGKTGKKANAPRLDAHGKAEEPEKARDGEGGRGAISSREREAEDPGRAGRDYLNHWLAIHGTRDKDADRDEAEMDRGARIREAERLRNLKPQASLDLHGKTAAEAEEAVRKFLKTCSQAGLEKVLVIHGKGNHSAGEEVLPDLVRRLLESDSLAGNFGPADKNHGGRGATWVRIRKRDYFSR